MTRLVLVLPLLLLAMTGCGGGEKPADTIQKVRDATPEELMQQDAEDFDKLPLDEKLKRIKQEQHEADLGPRQLMKEQQREFEREMDKEGQETDRLLRESCELLNNCDELDLP